MYLNYVRNMLLIKHRSNKLSDVDRRFGSEIDVRDYCGELILSHDIPTDTHITFEEYLEGYPRELLLAINVKSMGIEEKILKKIQQVNRHNYFVFDFAIPQLLQALSIGLVCAFRVSEYEQNIFDGCKWVWVDSFHNVWYDSTYLQNLKNMGLQIAIVSPDLHQRSSRADVDRINEMIDVGLVDAICTNDPESWIR
jgi:hypothetical protein